MKTVRLEYIDIIKGIGIFLVVLGHTTQNKELFNLIYAFHMPLFFIISGMFLHDKPGFIRKQAKSLLLPYLSFGLLTYLYWWLVESRFRELPTGETFFSQFVNLFFPTGIQHCNVVLWFLPCLFLSCIISNYINNRITSNKLKVVLLIGLICSVGFIGNGYPFYIGEAFHAIPYVIFGTILGRGNNILNINNLLNTHRIYIIIMALMGLIIIQISGITCNMQSCLYSPCYPASFIVGLLGFISIYVLAYSIQKNKILSWLGINSLAIMLIHEPIKRIMIKLYAMIINIPIDILRELLLHSIIVTILIVSPIVFLLNKKYYWLLGKNKSNS